MTAPPTPPTIAPMAAPLPASPEMDPMARPDNAPMPAPLTAPSPALLHPHDVNARQTQTTRPRNFIAWLLLGCREGDNARGLGGRVPLDFGPMSKSVSYGLPVRCLLRI